MFSISIFLYINHKFIAALIAALSGKLSILAINIYLFKKQTRTLIQNFEADPLKTHNHLF